MLDLGTVSGMAFIDTVVISSRNGPNTIPGVDSVPPGLPLLFHELVHVAQYRALGVRGFVREYLNGWLAGGRDYFAIPLERQAFELQRRFEREPSAHFRVESEIAGTWTGGVC
jgi:hypothetical protein